VLDLLEEQGLFERVERLGARLEARLHELVGAGVVGEVRRLGLMVACDLRLDQSRLDARQTVEAALAEGILLNATSAETLRFLPALVVSEGEIDRVGEFLAGALLSGRRA
jgi:acetylornithine/succinyldiaminopimelate/putrescine aminotransferase